MIYPEPQGFKCWVRIQRSSLLQPWNHSHVSCLPKTINPSVASSCNITVCFIIFGVVSQTPVLRVKWLPENLSFHCKIKDISCPCCCRGKLEIMSPKCSKISRPSLFPSPKSAKSWNYRIIEKLGWEGPLGVILFNPQSRHNTISIKILCFFFFLLISWIWRGI